MMLGGPLEDEDVSYLTKEDLVQMLNNLDKLGKDQMEIHWKSKRISCMSEVKVSTKDGIARILSDGSLATYREYLFDVFGQ